MGSGGRDFSREVGYNKANVEAVRNEINSIAQDTAKEIVDNINAIVEHVSTLWYSEIAVRYFQEFAEVVSSYETEVTNVFQSFNESLERAGQDWATTTEGEAPNMPAIDKVTLKIDISCIKNVNSEGDRFITTGLGEEVMQAASNAKYNISSYVEGIVQRADTSLAFFGGGQTEAIQEAAGRLGHAVEDILKFLTEGSDAIAVRSEEFDSSYTSTAQSNNQKFSDSSFGNIQ